MMVALLLNLNYKMDIIMIRHFGTATVVSIYSVAVGVADYLWLIPDSFKEVLFSKAAFKDKTDSFNISLKISVIFTSMASLVLLCIGKWAIPFLYGAEFFESYSVMAILLIGIPFMSVFKILSPLYVTQGDTRTYLMNLLCGIICNVILNAILIPKVGIMGAAVATVVSQISCGIYALGHYATKNHVPLKKIFTINSGELKSIKRIIKGRG